MFIYTSGIRYSIGDEFEVNASLRTLYISLSCERILNLLAISLASGVYSTVSKPASRDHLLACHWLPGNEKHNFYMKRECSRFDTKYFAINRLNT